MPACGAPNPLIEIGRSSSSKPSGMNNRKYVKGTVIPLEVLEEQPGRHVVRIPIEKAEVMQYDTSGPYGLTQDPPIWNEFLQILHNSANDITLTRVKRFDFYELAGKPDVCLTIATGEQRIWANVLLTVGVIKPPQG